MCYSVVEVRRHETEYTSYNGNDPAGAAGVCVGPGIRDLRGRGAVSGADGEDPGSHGETGVSPCGYPAEAGEAVRRRDRLERDPDLRSAGHSVKS